MRQTLLAHVNKTPVPPSLRIDRPIPAAVDALVMQCLAKDPAHRYASAGHLAAALEHVGGALQASASRAHAPVRRDATEQDTIVDSPTLGLSLC